jgi:hypothetical protein
MDVSDAKLLHCTLRITKIKVAKWGKPKKIFKKIKRLALLKNQIKTLFEIY